MRFRATFVFACVISAVPAASAWARPAMTTYLANMRSGPGPGYPVIAAIPDRSVVDMGSCARTWCRVTWNGASGYVAAGLLTNRIASPAVSVPVPVRAPAPAPEVAGDGYRYIYGGWGPYFCDPYFDPYCYNYTYFDNGGGWYWYDRRYRRWRPNPHHPPRPHSIGNYPRPRPYAVAPGRPRAMVFGPSSGVYRGVQGSIGRAPVGVRGGSYMSAPRSPSVSGGFGGARGGMSSPGGGFGGSVGGGARGGGGHGGGGFGGHGR